MLVLEAAHLAAPARSLSAHSPSKNPCMVRVRGQSRYRNDPYNYLVLPPIGGTAAQPPADAPTEGLAAQSWPLRRQLQPLRSDAFASSTHTGQFAARVKAEVQRASSEYAEPSPAISEEEEAEPTYVFVSFKHEACVYKSSISVSIGDVVVVEGDRGTNMGEVTSLLSEKPAHPVPSRVLRLANEEDRRQLRAARERDLGARELAKHLVNQFRMDISIVDAEFQTDGNKLTVYFAAPRPIDFRRLQRALFRQYHCRIWLVNWNELPQRQSRP